jgi:phosphoglycolate phosphatase-like HAD superfamily hydrolase
VNKQGDMRQMVNKLKLLKKVKLFWDIDGTLLRTNGAAALPFAEAVSEYAGVEVIIDRKKLSGFTDYEIAISLLGSVGITANLKDITLILQNYAEKLPAALNSGVVKKIGNIERVLEILLKIPKIELAVGTGNFLPGAKIKLNHVGLMNYFNDDNFFCASESYWSRDLIISNAKNSLTSDQVGIVIGDSPRDIKSAKHVGLNVIAVPTGSHLSDELSLFNPDLILENSWEIDYFINQINRLVKEA